MLGPEWGTRFKENNPEDPWNCTESVQLLTPCGIKLHGNVQLIRLSNSSYTGLEAELTVHCIGPVCLQGGLKGRQDLTK